MRRHTPQAHEGYIYCICVQVHEGRADSPGMDPDCQPVAAELWELATQPRVLSLARRLLGDDCVLHNQAQ